ncbi:response regulator transcription factor [Maricaulis salignorans]|uniref:Two component transcriptional regulator, LuxR family n=1 Tax=Maricaulis salignorans TaxID=144026 RepID=A0A1G9TY88_9PROT|nr:response regulator transcription factor [Maricaulis salignorans]SDM52553.1 two component transcriptional regulator, LuxR family [Maricaulis salignorans]
MPRLVLAEDQTMLREALAALLGLESDIEIVGTAANGREAHELVRRHDPDVVVTDIEMPDMTGLELAGLLQRSGVRARVLIVTTFDRPGYLRRALEAGVAGFILKDGPSTNLADAVRRVAAGERVIAPELAERAWSEVDPLNDAERRLLRLAEAGLESPAMAEATGLARGTVRNYLHSAISKLGAGNRIEAARLAREKGWL